MKANVQGEGIFLQVNEGAFCNTKAIGQALTFDTADYDALGIFFRISASIDASKQFSFLENISQIPNI